MFLFRSAHFDYHDQQNQNQAGQGDKFTVFYREERRRFSENRAQTETARYNPGDLMKIIQIVFPIPDGKVCLFTFYHLVIKRQKEENKQIASALCASLANTQEA